MTDKELFLSTYAPAAMEEQERSGIPASITLAQLIQEAGWKLSGLARNAKNLFGIKADKSWNGEVYYATTGEYKNGVYVQEVAAFRKYDSYADSFADHTKFLQENKRYANIFKTNDPYAIAAELERAGYATDPNYAEALSGLIKSNNLTQYDSGKMPTGSPAPLPANTVGLGQDILDGADDLRRRMTPGFIEEFWDSLFSGEPGKSWNPIERWKDATEDSARRLGQDFMTYGLVIVLVIFIIFLTYKTAAGV